VRVELWEWGVCQDDRKNPVGVCMTRHGAMAALSRALLAAGQPGHGGVGPVMLLDTAPHSDIHYLRFPVMNIAVYDQGVIRWERPSAYVRLDEIR